MNEQPLAARRPGPTATMDEILIWEQQRMSSRWPKPLLNWCPMQEKRDWQVDPIGSMLVQPLSDTKPLYQDKK